MRYSYRALGDLLVCSALDCQAFAARIPVTDVATATFSSTPNQPGYSESYPIQSSDVLDQRNLETWALSAEPVTEDYAVIFYQENEMRNSDVYGSAIGTVDTVLTIHNKEGSTIAVWLERDNKKVKMPGSEHEEYIFIPSNAWALIRMPKMGGYIGALRAFPGCGQNGDCFWGNLDGANLLEWTTHTPDGSWWIDLSLVRGYNMAMAVSGGGPRNTCEPLTCLVTAEAVDQLCPHANNLSWEGHAMCVSECTLTNDPQFCCTGSFGRGVCQSSNLHLKQFCNHYSWAHDDKHTRVCNPDGIINVELGGV